MNLNEIINKIEPEVCNGTGYKYTVDELKMQVIGDLKDVYDLLKYKKIRINSVSNEPYHHLSNAFIKIVQICKMIDVASTIGEYQIIESYNITDMMIDMIGFICREEYKHFISNFMTLCKYHNIDILKHVEGQLK